MEKMVGIWHRVAKEEEGGEREAMIDSGAAASSSRCDT